MHHQDRCKRKKKAISLHNYPNCFLRNTPTDKSLANGNKAKPTACLHNSFPQILEIKRHHKLIGQSCMSETKALQEVAFIWPWKINNSALDSFISEGKREAVSQSRAVILGYVNSFLGIYFPSHHQVNQWHCAPMALSDQSFLKSFW